MDNSSPTNERGLLLLPPDPLVSNTHCRHALIHSLTEKPVYQAVSLQNQADTTRDESYCCFSATKIAADLSVWDLDGRQSDTWIATRFPSPIKAVMLPVIHPQSLYHQILTDFQMPLTEEIRQNIAKLMDIQKRYLRSITSPVRAYLKAPIILVYIQEIEEPTPLEELIGNDLLSVAQALTCKIGKTDTFTSNLKNLLQAWQYDVWDVRLLSWLVDG